MHRVAVVDVVIVGGDLFLYVVSRAALNDFPLSYSLFTENTKSNAYV